MHAAGNGHVDIVKYLVEEASAEVNAINKVSLTRNTYIENSIVLYNIIVNSSIIILEFIDCLLLSCS